MNNEWERMRKEAVMALFKVLSRYLSYISYWRNQENPLSK